MDGTTVELTESLLAKLAGWDAVKQARDLVARDAVLSSDWQPPLLRGVVQEGSTACRAGLVIKDAINTENLCTCRASRSWGTICAHSVAVGLHILKARAAAAPCPVKPAPAPAPTRPAESVRRLRRAGAGESGERAEIFVILPPNLAPALAKGRITVCFEAQWSRGRTPLNALPLTTPFHFSAPDTALLDHLESVTGGEPPALVMLDAAGFGELLAKLAGHPRVTLGKSQPVEVATQPWPLRIRAALEDSGEITLTLAGAAPEGRVRGPAPWVFDARRLQPVRLPAGMEALFDGPIRIPRNRVPAFLNLDWPRLIAACEVDADFALDDFELAPATPRFRLHLAGGLAMLQARLECFYGDQPVTPGRAGPADAVWLPDPAVPTRYRTRNLAAEQAALGRLLRHGFSGPDAQGLHHLRGQEPILDFFAREYPRLQREWTVTLEERLERSTRQNLERIEPRFQITPSGEQWFDLGIEYRASGGEGFSPADIQRLLRSGQSHTRLRSGRFAVIDTGAVEELQEVLRDCAPQQHGQGYRLGDAQAGFLDATLRGQPGWQVQAPAAWAQRLAIQRGEIKPEPPPLGELESVLRPYQKEGVAWLHFLRTSGFGGVLADEMGLGKTLQVLAHLQSRTGPMTRDSCPALVVCPTSLVFNWVAEAAKFTPRLRVLALHGPERHNLFTAIPRHDLVVTSYAVLRRDLDRYRGIEFDTVALDEAQHIKNRQTQNAQAVKAVRARHRLVLTGTPIENSVLDLWSIFDFLMPGYLGSAADFRERYEVPIVRERSDAAQTRLARRVRPFVLRRLKREVAPDLPPRIDQVSYCELTDEQRAVYQQILEAGRRAVTEAVGANGLAKSRMVVLTALLRLRQVCCDLRLLGESAAADVRRPNQDEPGDIPPPYVGGCEASGKLELFGELLDEVLDGGHRVLVFSQFTRMLALIRELLAARGIQHCYLDGATRDRGAVVARFQGDASIPVFLIGLKAGGVGLNLTGADTVIHFDPWWNPAVERQAGDRAHRIGQRRVVTAYKLITRGTVEEKILALQERKRALFAGALGDEEQLAQALEWEEIQDLLATG